MCLQQEVRKINSHMSRDGFYGIDQSAMSTQGLENTIRARWWVESVPGPLKRGQEKCSCPLLSGPGTHQERLFARFFFFRDGNIDKAFLPPKDRASNEKRFASVDEASMVVLDKKRTPHATRRTTKKWPSIAKITSKRSAIWMQLRKNWQRDGP